MPAGPRVPSRRGPESALGDQHPEGTAPRPHSHLPALTRLPSYSPWGSRRLGLLGCWAGEARSPLATPGGRGRAQLATDWNVSPAGRHLVSICPAQLGPTSKGPPPGHFLCPGRPQGRHQDGPASSPPLCSPHQRGHPPPAPLNQLPWPLRPDSTPAPPSPQLCACVLTPCPQPPLCRSSRMASAWALPSAHSPVPGCLSMDPSGADTTQPRASPSWLGSPPGWCRPAVGPGSSAPLPHGPCGDTRHTCLNCSS